MDTLKVWRGSGKAVTRRTVASFGPFSKCFFSCFFLFYFTYANHLTATMDTSKLQRYLREVTTKRTGPNDVNRVVWVISTCFFLLIVFFYILIFIYNKYRCYGATEGFRKSYDEENGPKRCESRCLGH